MNIIQQLFEEALSPEKLLAGLIHKKLRSLGITLSQEQLVEIETRLKNLDGSNLAINIADYQLKSSGTTLEDLRRQGFKIDLGDFGDVDKFIGVLTDRLPELLFEIAGSLLKTLKADAPSMLKARKRETQRFEGSIRRTWGKALDLLEMFLVIASEAGADFNDEFRPKAAEELDYVFEVLTRLHARACQIGSEIHCLLAAGYADGAHARWRSLHEIAVVALFLKKFGQDSAERYLLHEIVESYKAAKEYQEHCASLCYEPLTVEEFEEIERKYKQVMARYDDSFRRNYGWAVPATQMEDPRFTDIERASGIQHLRPFYRLASHNVHANPKGVFVRLGLSHARQPVLLAGPSTGGIADPGHGLAISLQQITTSLLTTRPNLDRLVICTIMQALQMEIGQEFLVAHGIHAKLSANGHEPPTHNQ